MTIKQVFLFLLAAGLCSCGVQRSDNPFLFTTGVHPEASNATGMDGQQPLELDPGGSSGPIDSLILEEERFSKVVLVENLNEPTEFEVLEGGNVLFIQRRGGLMLYDPVEDRLTEVARLDVHTNFEDGLMGLALDPNYEENHWIYLYYSPVGEEPKQHLSRFVYRDGLLDTSSEIIMLEVAVQRRECCHTGGSIEFGPDGNLFLSTGDDVNPFASDGYAPIDERPGREPWDAQGSSANPNDLRGKILRIRPNADGSYSIPEGNLFPEGLAGTRPEIYIMGNRNPYRISIDQKTGYLYWGEVGPDANEDHPDRGPRGHDEVNQARAAGFFGWPYFVGDNKAYNDYDFETKVSGPRFDPTAPVNNSPNNTGIRELPPAQKAFIWYPYGESPEFPILGAGGRNAMAGPVFYSEMYTEGEHTFPDVLDGRLFIYDWIRGWIMVVTMDENGDLERIDPFMPSTTFNNPIDMQFDDEGVMYVMEYGTGWFSQNPDARISRIEYNAGNLPPVVTMTADRTVGAAPLTVAFSAEGTRDYEDDPLSFAWHLKGGDTIQSTDTNVRFTYEEPGIYMPRLVVSDAAGNVVEKSMQLKVGNEPPEVEFILAGNRTFFWDDRTMVSYRVRVEDAEDGSLEEGGIEEDEVFVQMDYISEGYDKTLVEQGHRMADETSSFMSGKRLIDESDCSACHQIDRESIGPTYRQVAERYRDDEDAEEYLVEKIRAGGGGVWGEQAMAAHPQLTDEQLLAIVHYILSLSNEQPTEGHLGVEGELIMDAHRKEENGEGMYFLRAVYTDRGARGIGPLAEQDIIVLRHSRVQAEAYDEAHEVGRPDDGYIYDIADGSYIAFEAVDLTGVATLVFQVKAPHEESAGGRIEIRIDAPDGPVIGSADIDAAVLSEEGRTVAAAIETQSGARDLYMVFKSRAAGQPPPFALDWVLFER